MARKVILDTAAIDASKLYNSAAAAELLGVSAATIRYLAWSGKLKGVKIGRRLYFRGQSLLDYIGVDQNTPA